jgi:hypothetical protein
MCKGPEEEVKTGLWVLGTESTGEHGGKVGKGQPFGLYRPLCWYFSFSKTKWTAPKDFFKNSFRNTTI